MAVSYKVAADIVRYGIEFAESAGYLVAIAVLDDAGHLVALGRMDGARFLAPEVARAKAMATVHFKRSTRELEESAARKPAFFSAFSHMNAGTFAFSQGGLPLWGERDIIGGVGVSGTSAKGDEEVAIAAFERLGFPIATPAGGESAVAGEVIR